MLRRANVQDNALTVLRFSQAFFYNFKLLRQQIVTGNSRLGFLWAQRTC